MRALPLASRGERLSILCLGAHSDDIEIGVGGTILSLLAEEVELDVHWCVLSATGERAAEATTSANAFLTKATSSKIECAEFEDSFFPSQRRQIKTWLTLLRGRTNAEVVFTHSLRDSHQDHREISQLTTNIFRDHIVLEYEIPKWDGDLTARNAYVPFDAPIMEQKIDLLMKHFATQRSKDWFDPDTFRGLARLRGVECRAPGRFAEAFTIRKLRLC
ncbi:MULTISPECIES: PIG-L deacetylase family protein [unclassified Rhizobium]|uniref:PIG-L deacetylase family protein n=1 Tax=unclassified Rhizobium TaxID=2613769 RepID=UPI000714CA65|nr:MULTISPECIES: PIG-L deacetylase family protein [unclassified Rhizobium]KQT04774.1 GlcNAc-PI de-N-acetylase [Rhizobium sp. Leaf386]KQU02126.1 GlcNAc-PI de-N-acetylase [Rhizobium sp. Leaf453]